MLHEIPARFTKEQMQYLRDKSKKTGDSIAVILRHLVIEDKKKNDRR